jgi:hypothetical protein
MNLSLRERLKIMVILLLILVVVMFSYTTLHEGGHALAALAFGARITDFNVNVFNLGAHMNYDGVLSTPQTAVVNVAGVGLPLLTWSLLLIFLPKRNNWILQWVKIALTMGYLNTLLAWVVLPFLYLSHSAPPSDDVTKFITNSGIPVLAVAVGALGLYALGWLLFSARIGSIRQAFMFLRGDKGSLPPQPKWKIILISAIILAFFAGGLALVFQMTSAKDPAAVPPGYKLAAAINLSERAYNAEIVASFTLAKKNDAAVFLRVEGLNTKYIDVSLIPPEGEPLQLLHGEDFTADVSSNQAQYRLPAGQSNIVLTCPKSVGLLEVYLRVP